MSQGMRTCPRSVSYRRTGKNPRPDSTRDAQRPTVERAGLLLDRIVHFQRPGAGRQFAVQGAQTLEWTEGPSKRGRSGRDRGRRFVIEHRVAQILAADAFPIEQLN